ncbi:hypothetical protein NF552_22220 (plasmid) [Roseomonas mucosa]|nr:hypothetical protein NF552_22220 [Roseomonas mucosa]
MRSRGRPQKRTGPWLGETIPVAVGRYVDVLGEASLNEYGGRMSSQIKPEDVTVGAAAVGMAIAEDRAS